jgi:hypothetical protein
MIDDAQRIFDYLPQEYKTKTESDYIDFLWDAFSVNYEKEKYQFAYIAYHMLFMCFIYFQLSKIYKNKPDDLKNIMLFTDKAYQEIENHERKNNQSSDPISFDPFNFSKENERTIMGLFLSIGCDREIIKKMKSLVNMRNGIAHSNGNIFFRSLENIDEKIEEILNCMDCIQQNCIPIIIICTEKFIIEGTNTEEREFPDEENQVREIFVRGNYLSMKDINIAKKYDIQVYEGTSVFPAINRLYMTIRELYSE